MKKTFLRFGNANLTVAPALTFITFTLLCGGCGELKPPRADLKDATMHEGTDSNFIEISGSEGEAFMNAMRDAGISDETHLIGSLNLKATHIDCTAPLVPNPEALCRVQSLETTAAPAKTIYTTLKENNAVIPTRLLGVVHVRARDITCSRPVVPDAVSTCWLKLSAQE